MFLSEFGQKKKKNPSRNTDAYDVCRVALVLKVEATGPLHVSEPIASAQSLQQAIKRMMKARLKNLQKKRSGEENEILIIPFAPLRSDF